jgi:hypothetical protein
MERMESAKRAVITVGDGRGFVVEGNRGKLCVITAAHCLQDLPPAHPGSYLEERTYPNLLGRIGVPTLPSLVSLTDKSFMTSTMPIVISCRIARLRLAIRHKTISR